MLQNSFTQFRANLRSQRLSPVIKWAGGKEAELKYILPNLLNQFERYLEPFVCGGRPVVPDLFSRGMVGYGVWIGGVGHSGGAGMILRCHSIVQHLYGITIRRNTISAWLNSSRKYRNVIARKTEPKSFAKSAVTFP